MVGSLWRYSHFMLAAISAVFLLLASITGAILAFEPISKNLRPFDPVDLETVYLLETIESLKRNYSEVLELEVTPEGFVKAAVFTEEGNSEDIFVHPRTGEKLGEATPQSPFFSFVTNLHRSLFLKSIGRAFVGIVSLILCFIGLTGMFLLAQRQGGFKKWFTKVQERNFEQRYHVLFSRWLLLPILLVAFTGVWLSAEKFSLLPEPNLQYSDSSAKTTIKKHFFEALPLSEVRNVMFPFSEDPEDYYEVALKEREIRVEQHTGKVLSEAPYPFVKLANMWNLKWHTGQGSVIWSIVLLIASLGIVFFIYSGLAMSVKRLKKSKTVVGGSCADEAEYVVLVGSETRNTFMFAKAFQKALLKSGKAVHLADLNAYTTYPKASHLVIFTATYGDGDAPSNARRFEAIFEQKLQAREIQYAVLGFGSLKYPNYCQFAVKVSWMLQERTVFRPLLPLTKINDRSETAFKAWVREWNGKTGMNLQTEPFSKKDKGKSITFEILEHSGLNVDNTALIRLRPKRKLKFRSGDLLNIVPPNETIPRKYSIAKMGRDLLISVKWHPKGKCSTYLSIMKTGETLMGTLEKNPDFHFPRKAPSVWMVANGTGIAPFLGMLNERNDIAKKLTWGGREEASFLNYKDLIDERNLHNGERSLACTLAFSQKNPKRYVQNVLLEQKSEVAHTLESGGVFMLCGSLKMQQSVLRTLNEITTEELDRPLSDYENKGQLLMDCY